MDDMSYLRDDPFIAESLRSVAYVNVKKCTGETQSNLDDIYDWFKKGESVIRNQFYEYKPDVVIGCAPYMVDVFKWDTTRSSPVFEPWVTYVSDYGKPLLIDAYHPSQRGRREGFVDSIVEVVEQEFKKEPNRAMQQAPVSA